MKNNESTSFVFDLINSILKNKFSRNLLLPQLDKYVRDRALNDDKPSSSESIKLYKYYAFRAMYMSYFKNYDKGMISSEVTRRVLKTLLGSVIIGDKKSQKSRTKFQNINNQLPPKFITISPTKKCNLNCIGCYASSNTKDVATINWTLLNRIIEDVYTNMGMRFFVISGGEPLLYKSENKTILDLAQKWSDCFFLMYTNGTLISEEVAKKMALLGNITPAISIEGYEIDTDKRRGNGVYEKIFTAKNNLINHGVPFGLSVTATKENINQLLDHGFYDYYFNLFGASYMWFFHYMPIGREFSTDLMITPKQRIELFNMQNKVLIEDKLFIADFWNGAIISDGCISSGSPHGYFYINWDGNIMPCVFVPHYVDNVKTLYNSGKTLTDALFSPLFEEGKKWQKRYTNNKGKLSNLLMPCLYRDHYKDFFEIAKGTNAKPENQAAGDAINSKEYYDKMLLFSEELDKESSPIWKNLVEEKH